MLRETVNGKQTPRATESRSATSPGFMLFKVEGVKFIKSLRHD